MELCFASSCLHQQSIVLAYSAYSSLVKYSFIIFFHYQLLEQFFNLIRAVLKKQLTFLQMKLSYLKKPLLYCLRIYLAMKNYLDTFSYEGNQLINFLRFSNPT